MGVKHCLAHASSSLPQIMYICTVCSDISNVWANCGVMFAFIAPHVYSSQIPYASFPRGDLPPCVLNAFSCVHGTYLSYSITT